VRITEAIERIRQVIEERRQVVTRDDMFS